MLPHTDGSNEIWTSVGLNADFFGPHWWLGPPTQRSQANIRVTYLHRAHTQVQTLTLLFPNKQPGGGGGSLAAQHLGSTRPRCTSAATTLQHRDRGGGPRATLLLGSTWPRRNGLAGARGSAQQEAHISRLGDEREQRSGDRRADRQRAATQRLLWSVIQVCFVVRSVRSMNPHLNLCLVFLYSDVVYACCVHV
jgi:hypothetical protein